MKFTEVGEVRLEIRAVWAESGTATFEFDVTDTGVGMTEEQARKLFVPFSQADSSASRKYGGTGLGLAISRRLAQAMGGDVWLLWTAWGEGTSFRVAVPVGSLEGGAPAGQPGART